MKFQWLDMNVQKVVWLILALGSIGTVECLPILKQFQFDDEIVVRESCQIGLDMWVYENEI